VNGWVRLIWTFLRRATGTRRWGPAIAAGIAALVLLAVAALPAAYLSPDLPEADTAALTAVSLILCLPVIVLVVTVSRLSNNLQRRRAIALALLGVTRVRIRVLASAEVGIMAAAGALGGALAGLLALPAVSEPLHRSGVLRQPMAVSLTSCFMVVVLTVAVAAASAGVSPSRRGAATSGRGPRRRSASPWRAVPLLVGVGGSATLLNWDRQGFTGDDLIRFFFINAAFLVIGAVGLVLTLPLVSTWAAVLLLRLPNQPTLRLAARRLEVDPTSASRLVGGFGVALFLVTASLGVVAALETAPRYLAEQHAVEVGPQLHTLVQPSPQALQDAAGTPGVTAVVPTYSLSCGDRNVCGNVFYGTCQGLSAVMGPAPTCRDDTVSLLRITDPKPPFYPPGHIPAIVTIVSADAPGREATVPLGPGLVDLPHWSWDLNRLQQFSLFVPVDTPGLRQLLTNPGTAVVTTGAGYTVRDALSRSFGRQIELQDARTYESTSSWRVVVWALLLVSCALALATTMIAAIDRNTEHRNEASAHLAIGVPAHVLKGAQSLQTLIPAAVVIGGSIAIGYLGARSFVNAALLIHGSDPGQPIAAVLSAAAACLLAATLASLTGSTKLTTSRLRRE